MKRGFTSGERGRVSAPWVLTRGAHHGAPTRPRSPSCREPARIPSGGTHHDPPSHRPPDRTPFRPGRPCRRWRPAGPHRSSLVSRRTGLLHLRPPRRHRRRTSTSALSASKPTTDEQKALAAWLWRNTHYFHGEEGTEDLWGKGFTKGADHAQPRILDRPVRPRLRPVRHHAFAVGRRDGGAVRPQSRPRRRRRRPQLLSRSSSPAAPTARANGSCSITTSPPSSSTSDGSALLSIAEVQRDWKHLTDRDFKPERQHGWLVCGLHPDDGGAYQEYDVAEYLAGYAGPPPMVHLRRGETLAPLPAARPGRRQDVRLLGPQLQHRRHPRAGAVAHLGQPAGEDAPLDAAPPSTSPARPASATPSTSTSPISPVAITAKGVVEEDDKHVVFEF